MLHENDHLTARNRSCFVCWHFDGMLHDHVVCAHPKPPMLHAYPALGCSKQALNPHADQTVNTVAQWRASLSSLPGHMVEVRGHNGVGGDARPALTDDDIRSLYYEVPCGSTRTLVWEVHRLQLTLCRVRSALQMVCAKPMSVDARTALKTLSAWLTQEPGVQAVITEQVKREKSRFRDK